MSYIEEECKNIMSPELEKALNVFRYNRIRDMIRYNIGHRENPLSKREIKELNSKILETPSAVALLSSNMTPTLNRYNRLQYNSYKSNTIFLTYYYLEFGSSVRRKLGKILRILRIKKKQDNIIR